MGAVLTWRIMKYYSPGMGDIGLKSRKRGVRVQYVAVSNKIRHLSTLRVIPSLCSFLLVWARWQLVTNCRCILPDSLLRILEIPLRASSLAEACTLCFSSCRWAASLAALSCETDSQRGRMPSIKSTSRSTSPLVPVARFARVRAACITEVISHGPRGQH